MSRNVALVLSGGGARGFAHIGAIKVLENHGYTITSVAGTSMGALVGGIYASGRISEFEEWVSSLDVMEILKLTDISLSSKGFVKGTRVIDKLKEIVHDRDIEDLPIPYCAIATDLIREGKGFSVPEAFSTPSGLPYQFLLSSSHSAWEETIMLTAVWSTRYPSTG